MTDALAIAGVAKAFGGVRALRGVDLELRQGEILGLIGPNGSGKTTLVNVVSGFLRPDAGTIRLGERELTGLPPHLIARAGVARTFQNLRIFRRRTALGNILLGQTTVTPALELLSPLRGPAERGRRADAAAVLARFRLAGREEAIAGALSFGEQKRLELARALAGKPAVLLLDEPAGGMNPSEIDELTGILRGVRDDGVSILLIEHNMKLVMGVCDRIAVLSFGEMVTSGTPEAIRKDERVIRSYLGEE